VRLDDITDCAVDDADSVNGERPVESVVDSVSFEFDVPYLAAGSFAALGFLELLVRFAVADPPTEFRNS
jgi:hypothetical protein